MTCHASIHLFFSFYFEAKDKDEVDENMLLGKYKANKTVCYQVKA
jgi:hypothetical protein